VRLVFVRNRAAWASVGGQDAGVSDLPWDDVRKFFDPDLMGTLPDVWVADTSVDDWQAVLDLIADSGWRSEYVEGDALVPLSNAEQVLSRSVSHSPTLRVWPSPEVLAIFRFWSEDVIDFDVDLRELQGQERLDVLVGFLGAIGRTLGKSVFMSAEGDWGLEHPVLGFDVRKDRVVLLANPEDN
jgi:hypothetical protein